MNAGMSSNPFDSDEPGLLDVVTRAAGPAGRAAADGEMLRDLPSGAPVRVEPERRDGMGPVGADRQGVPDPLDSRRHPRARRHAHRPRLSHRPLGGRPVDGGRRAGVQAGGGDPVRGGVHRPVRRAVAGDDRDVRQPPLPERRRDDFPSSHPIAADTAGRARRRDVRQGPAGDDDGARRQPRPVVRPRSRRRDAAAVRRRRRRPRTVDRRPLRPRPDRSGRGGRCRVPRLRVARRRLSVPRHRRDVAGRG